MAIDITNKNEKQIALTGAEIESALLKANDIQSSASEIDNMVTNGATQADLDALALSTGNLNASQATSLLQLSNKNMIDLQNTANRVDTNKTKLFLELPEPSLVPNEFVYRIGGVPLLCYSDGVNWHDVAKQEIMTTWWLPKDCEIYVDFINSRFYFNGAVKLISDLVYEGTNLYSLPYALTSSDITIISTSYKIKDSVPAGTLLSFSGGVPSGHRIDLNPYNTDEGRYYIGGFVTAGQYVYPNYKSKLAESGVFKCDGRRTVCSVFSKTNGFKNLVNNSTISSAITPTINNDLTFTRIGFNCGVHTSSGVNGIVSGCGLEKVMIFKKSLSTFELETFGKGGVVTPLHLVGDSFLNNYVVTSGLNLLLSNLSYPIGISQDNEGGMSMTAHAIRYANNNSKWYDSVLIIGEFGFDGTNEDFIIALKDMLGRLKHNKWLILEPAPLVAGTQESWDLKLKEVIDIAGDRYIRTLAPAFALSNGSTEDIAEVNKGLWPLSLKISTSNFHPSKLGYSMISELIYDKLIELGWVK